jgi:glycosyltransferase involved in cell wall biosynthesis
VSLDAAGRERMRALLGIAPQRFVVGWIGRMTGVKRTDDILLALRGLRASAACDACLLMVGDGPGPRTRPSDGRRSWRGSGVLLPRLSRTT